MTLESVKFIKNYDFFPAYCHAACCMCMSVLCQACPGLNPMHVLVIATIYICKMCMNNK